MKQLVEEYLGNLLSMGFEREAVLEKGYDYALALQTDALPKGDSYVPAAMMVQAAQLVKEALPGAYRIYDIHNRIR